MPLPVASMALSLSSRFRVTKRRDALGDKSTALAFPHGSGNSEQQQNEDVASASKSAVENTMMSALTWKLRQRCEDAWEETTHA